jgi:hypothetical protein
MLEKYQQLTVEARGSAQLATTAALEGKPVFGQGNTQAREIVPEQKA